METHEIWQALGQRSAPPVYVFLSEVRDAAGFDARRSADGIAMCVWPSRGLELHGIEVKASRSDWLRELKKPEKQETIFRYCDRFWLAVGSDDIVQEGELPPTWGLLIPHGNKLVVKVAAHELKPEPISRSFLASLLRNASQSSASLVQVQMARNEGYAAGEKAGLGKGGNVGAAVVAFEAAAGISIRDHWDAGHVGEAVRMVLDGHHVQLKRQLEEFEKKTGVEIDSWNGARLVEAMNLVRRHGNTPAGLEAQLREVLASARKVVDGFERDLEGAFQNKESARE